MTLKHLLGGVLITAVAIAVIGQSNAYLVYVLSMAGLTAVVGIGLNILVGLTGQISLGHVGFYAGEDPGAFLILGGNQSDAVNTVRVSRDRFLGARWPLTALPPGGETRVVDAGGALSTNEA